jgi:hypothetical protein
MTAVAPRDDVTTSAEVSRLLAQVRTTARGRDRTTAMRRVVDVATHTTPSAPDAARVLPVAAELRPLLPLQLHHLNGKTQMRRVRCRNVTQTRLVATVDGDCTKLVDRGCYEAWSRELGSAAEPSS